MIAVSDLRHARPSAEQIAGYEELLQSLQILLSIPASRALRSSGQASWPRRWLHAAFRPVRLVQHQIAWGPLAAHRRLLVD